MPGGLVLLLDARIDALHLARALPQAPLQRPCPGGHSWQTLMSLSASISDRYELWR